MRSVAFRYRELGLPFDDLVQEGSLGLLEAIDHYDPSRRSEFESYARFRVRRAICNALTNQARLIRLPKQAVERRRAIDRTDAALTAASNGRAPTPAQLASATGLSLTALREARAAALASLSLDERVLPDGSPLESVLADQTASSPESEALDHEQTHLLYAALEKLPERPRYIVGRRWGLDGAPQSIAAIAAELELSPRRTQTISADALHELRAVLEPTGLSRMSSPSSRSSRSTSSFSRPS